MAFKNELKKPKYWAHLAIILAVLTLALHFIGVMIHESAWVIAVAFTALAVGDIVAHKIMNLD